MMLSLCCNIVHYTNNNWRKGFTQQNILKQQNTCLLNSGNLRILVKQKLNFSFELRFEVVEKVLPCF